MEDKLYKDKNGCSMQYIGNYRFVGKTGKQTYVKCIKYLGVVYVPYHSTTIHQKYYKFANDIMVLDAQPYITVSDEQIKSIGGQLYR